MSNLQSIFPACHVVFPASADSRRATFYLAAEEYIAQKLPADNYLFSWQLSPTVVIGRNQVVHQEINLDFCQAEGIDVVRRKSGGGAIFADQHNIMWSLVTTACAVEPLFQVYAHEVARSLDSLGTQTEVSGRNDITLKNGGKICGNAFYHLANHNIVHGTMLYDTNPRLMQGALTPDVSKLQSKGVSSVRSRVALLKDVLTLTVTELRSRLSSLMTNRTYELTENDLAGIEKLEEAYNNPAYLYGRITSDVERKAVIPGCGTVALYFKLRGTIIEDVHLTGDFFELADAQKTFHDAFCQVTFTPQNMENAIRNHHPERTIRNLTTEQLLQMLS